MDIMLCQKFHAAVKHFSNTVIKKRQYFQTTKPAIILGIETSCDDTGCAIVDSNGNILGEGLHSQLLAHLNYGGIVPPLAQNMHREHITDVCEKALKTANLRLRDIDAIATTVKPGLPLSLLLGTNFGKYLSRIGKKPFIPIHHMEAHALTARMVEKVDYPFLVLLISGGHCLLAIVKDVATFYLLGASRDNSPGETFDKIARRLKIKNIPEYSNISGGAAIELAASRATNPLQFALELPMAKHRDCGFSFAGLQNTVYRHIEQQENENNIVGDATIPGLNNLCAGVQMTTARHLCHRAKRAMEFCTTQALIPKENATLVVSGGVACNNYLVNALEIVGREMGYRLVRPPPRLCTDNGVMIAWNGMEKWITNTGILRDPEEIEKVVIQSRAPLGEDWRQKVLDKHIACKAIKTRELWS